MRIIIFTLAAVAALVANGCYSPSLLPCAVSCSASSPCPDDLVCNADGFCHADGDGASCTTTTLHEVTVSLTGTGVGQVTSDVGGIGCAPLCTAQIAEGTRVTLSASPMAGARFIGWVGSACSGTLGCSFVVNGPIQIGAGFNALLPLTLAIGGNGGGTVTSAPMGISCTDDCIGQFESGTPVTLTAAPDATSRFGTWAQACVGTSGTSCGLTVSAATNVGVDFIRTAAVTVAPTGGGTGGVTSNPSGITCTVPGPGTCTQRFDVNASITLTAAATGRSEFRRWAIGGACANSTDPTCTFTLAADTTAIPTFIERRTVTVVITGTEGAVTGSVACSASSDPCTLPFDQGASIVLGTTATAKWRFLSWSSPPCPTSSGMCPFTLMEDATVTATFIEQHDLVAQVSGTGGTVQVTPPGQTCIGPCTTTHDSGAQVAIDAIASPGYRFLDWLGDCSTETTSMCTLTMNGARNASARFMQMYPLTLVVAGPGEARGAGGGATINCRDNTCVAQIDSGTVFPLTITPDAGSRITSVVGCIGNAPCNVLLDMARTVTVTYAGGVLVWSKRYGGTPYYGRESIEDVDVDGQARVTVTGTISGGTTMNFGGGITRVAGPTQRSILVARYSSTGVVEWAHIFDPINISNNASASGSAIAVASNGDVVIGGTFNGTLTVGMTSVTSAGGFDAFVFRINGAGTPGGLERFGGLGDESVAALGFAGGNLDLLIRASGSTSVSIAGGPALVILGGSVDIVASVSPGPMLVHRWSKILLPTNVNTTTTQIVIANNSDPILVGYYGGAGAGPNFGGATLADGQRRTGFIVRLADPDGAHVWSNDYGGASPGGQLNSVQMVDARMTPAGDAVTVVGWFDDIGGPFEDVSGTAPSSFPMTRQGRNDMFVANYAEADGAHLSSFRFGSANLGAGTSEIPVGLAIDLSGDLAITGLFTSASMTNGPDTISNLGGNDVFVLKMTSAGVGTWIRRLGAPGEERVTAIDVSVAGTVAVGGSYLGDHTGALECTLDGVGFDSVDEGYLLVFTP